MQLHQLRCCTTMIQYSLELTHRKSVHFTESTTHVVDDINVIPRYLANQPNVTVYLAIATSWSKYNMMGFHIITL